MPYKTKPMTAKELSKTILIGIGKGILYYIIYCIVLLGLITHYIIPYLMEISGIEGFNAGSMVGFELINANIILLFMLLSIIGTFLVRHVPYGRALDSLVGLLMLYIVLLMFNFGKFEGYIAQYNIYYDVDLSPLFRAILLIVALFTLGQVFVSMSREYKSRKTHIETGNTEIK